MSDVKKLATALSKARAAYPRQRLGELIANAVFVADGPDGDRDCFHFEDEELIRALERYAQMAEEAT